MDIDESRMFHENNIFLVYFVGNRKVTDYIIYNLNKGQCILIDTHSQPIGSRVTS